MKGLVAIAVVIIHLVVVVVVLRSRERSEPEDAPPTPTQAARAALPVQPAAGNPAAPPPRPSPTAAERPPPPVRLASAVAALPPALQRQTQACRTGIVVDWQRKTILWQKQPQYAVPIASMSKMMTALLLMEAIEQDPKLSLQTQVQVTTSAMRIGGSQVYLDPRESFSIEDLLRCIMIFSANDAAYLISEFLGNGSEARFVERMNRRAQELGMPSLAFYNAHGLAAGEGHNRGNAVDLALLAGRLLQYDDVVKWAGTWLSYLRADTKPFQLANRNTLVKTCDGVNGMKTGYTKEAGFCIAATAQRRGLPLIVVVTGCATKTERNDLVAALFDWGYKQAAITAATTLGAH